MLKRNLLLLCFFTITLCTSAQRIALKTNTLDWLVASPNIGTEFILSSSSSFNINVSASPFSTSFFKNKHALLGIEYKHWFTRPLTGHFVGVMAHIDEYDRLLLGDYHKGNQIAAGFTYGYNMVLSERWNLEFELGLGYMRQREKKWDKDAEIPQTNNNNKNTFAPIKLAVSFSYIIK
jgi:hypothetical protein